MGGHKNTSFFHAIVQAKKARNAVNALHNGDGDWIFDQVEFKELAYKFFENLYSSERPPFSIHFLTALFHPLSGEILNYIQREVSNIETKNTVSSMGGFKVPSLDGL